jgi:DNA segregation ATPase FtsK/SpoIIIE-like protein
MKKKIAISKDALITMGGITLCLFALVIICSSNPDIFLSFLSIGILAAFGFVGFWLLVPAIFLLGLYWILRRKLIKFRIDIALWGIYLIILAALVLFSAYGSEGQVVKVGDIEYTLSMFNTGDNYKYLEFNTCTDFFKQIADNYATAHGISSGYTMFNNYLGGGFLGYVLCGALNSAITPIGTTVISWIVAALGICLLFNRQIKKLFILIKTRKQRKAAHDDVYSLNEEETAEDVIYENADGENNNNQSSAGNKLNEVDLADLSMRNFNNNHGLREAIFSIGDDEEKQPLKQLPEQNSSGFMRPTNSLFGAASIGQNEVKQEPDGEPANENNCFDEAEEIAPIFLKQDEVIEDKEEELIPQPEIEESLDSTPAEPQIAEVPVQPIVKPQPEITDFLHKPQPKAIIKAPFKLPPLDLLDYHEDLDDLNKNNDSCTSRVNLINQVFLNMHIGAEITGYTIGPSVTRFDVKTNDSVSVSSIKRIIEDISIKLGGVPARFEPIVIGKPTSGLEIENEIRTNVGLRESIEKLPEGTKYLCDIPFGKDICGNLVHASLKDFPHMLVGGATGSGKSIFIHACIISLIMRNNPDNLKLLLIDPKKVEMNYYENIPHLLCPNISETRKALVAFNKLCDEMERRYNLFQANRVRDIKEFNVFAKEKGLQPLPTIVVFVDEYADLTQDCKEIRKPVLRIAQKARSAGIHMIIATQRPSVDVIDGVIKSNLPTHVALMVSNYTDSTVIIGEQGAEKLLGNGDMIVECPSISRNSKPRVQGCFVATSEINRVTDYLREQCKPQFDPNFMDLEEHDEVDPYDASNYVIDTAALREASEDQLYEQIKTDLVHKEYCSISFIQRTYGVGFPKAGRLFAKLQKDGIVAYGGDAKGSKVIVHLSQSESPTSIDESKIYQDEEENIAASNNANLHDTREGIPQVSSVNADDEYADDKENGGDIYGFGH